MKTFILLIMFSGPTGPTAIAQAQPSMEICQNAKTQTVGAIELEGRKVLSKGCFSVEAARGLLEHKNCVYVGDVLGANFYTCRRT